MNIFHNLNFNSIVGSCLGAKKTPNSFQIFMESCSTGTKKAYRGAKGGWMHKLGTNKGHSSICVYRQQCYPQTRQGYGQFIPRDEADDVPNCVRAGEYLVQSNEFSTQTPSAVGMYTVVTGPASNFLYFSRLLLTPMENITNTRIHIV